FFSPPPTPTTFALVSWVRRWVKETDTARRGMCNIGHRPTVDAPGAPESIEVNIFDFDADIYGRKAEVRFLDRLRDEKKFNSLDELARALEADRRAARAVGTMQ
ncbi:MAG: hypothetical protein K2L16_04155, partial [Muribaculaceae bacterium]|nr:hypothetical protein [Muribaculaceae bacterium]